MAKKWQYSSGGNSELKLALWENWNFKCYWCDVPKDYNDTQVDHMVPKSLTPEELTEVKRGLQLADAFHLDDPENLAPICSRCNGMRGKSGTNYVRLPRMMSLIRRAGEIRAKVIQRVEDFPHSGNLTRAFVILTSSNPDDPSVRKAFADHGPAIAQKLALLGGQPNNARTVRRMEFEADDNSVELLLSPDDRGSTTLTLLEEVCDSDLQKIAENGFNELVASLRDSLQCKFEDLDDVRSEVGPQAIQYLGIHFKDIDFRRSDRRLDFSLAGTLEWTSSCSIVRESSDGGGLESVQGDAFLYLQIKKDLIWNMDDGLLEDGGFSIVEWTDEDISSEP